MKHDSCGFLLKRKIYILKGLNELYFLICFFRRFFSKSFSEKIFGSFLPGKTEI